MEPLLPLPLDALPELPPLALAVVGHVEMVSFIGVEHLPAAGEILHADDFCELPAGGGAVVAVQMARLTGGRIPFFTALGDDAVGRRAADELEGLGLELHIAWREAPTRRGITFIDAGGERTITVIGERLMPTAADGLPWQRLAGADGVFATATDAAGLRLARRARVLAATPRVRLATLREAGVTLDALIGSSADPGEAYRPGDLEPAPSLYIGTEAERGGVLEPGGRYAAVLRQGPVLDAYGAGDSFAAGVTTALAAGWSLQDAISLGAHCGAASLDGRGPYASQLQLRRC
ncbi:ribokinase [Cyanobium sp. AMD-g]|uniref:PfkB family carbohydrate kinase n=1 Tax=Cyanobium sp. AMD-g TaxID=2823699 RepID=UPI0020CDA7E9|nr:PfkB family carbohydrate kinase [Cyanobium sp. AMD-g]MCP9931834.1 ribokinase [Cyanobium sp. AMD-g]